MKGLTDKELRMLLSCGMYWRGYAGDVVRIIGFYPNSINSRSLVLSRVEYVDITTQKRNSQLVSSFLLSFTIYWLQEGDQLGTMDSAILSIIWEEAGPTFKSGYHVTFDSTTGTIPVKGVITDAVFQSELRAGWE